MVGRDLITDLPRLHSSRRTKIIARPFAYARGCMLWRLGLLLSPSIGLELDLVGNRFVADSPLEGGGFEPSIPRREWHRFAIVNVNVWRPVRGPVQDSPVAPCAQLHRRRFDRQRPHLRPCARRELAGRVLPGAPRVIFLGHADRRGTDCSSGCTTAPICTRDYRSRTREILAELSWCITVST